MVSRVILVGARSGSIPKLTRLIEIDGTRRVVGSTGSDGAIAALLRSSRADLVLVDLAAECGNGLQLVERVRSVVSLPVVALLGPENGTESGQYARQLGATSVLRTPLSSRPSTEAVRSFLAGIDRALGRTTTSPKPPSGKRAAPVTDTSIRPAPSIDDYDPGPPISCPAPSFSRELSCPLPPPDSPGSTAASKRRVIAIGASTGGTETTRKILQAFPQDAPPVLVVQHISEAFAPAYAKRLDQNCQMRAKLAEDGDTVERGQILVAPGDDHMTLVRSGGRLRVQIEKGSKVQHHRPSVDVLFHSVASILRKQAVGILLTGMGKDGAAGLLAMREAGAFTLAQDEKTSIVYGMPRAAALLNAAERILPLDHIARETLRACAA